MAGAPRAEATRAGTPRAAAAFNAIDIAWIQLMIPMDERARLLTDLAGSRAGDPALARFAQRAAERQGAELTLLRGLLARSAAPDTRPHEGHDMPVMVSADTLRAHLTQSLLLCAGERSSGGSGEARELAGELEKAGSARLALLDAARSDKS
ncbi:DUF305 domain-containing protein [Streptomyces sp. AP-93]|uniref:DUF305 domain-containing protein n=1 Tax=Streptomyces sp. AP-93 TaxID=2929048 RepID=UPI001FAFA4A2|nr:DUF305 domain-containing protein [Streptomyces sp. AP-93]MCJ0869813.1 DUF305 domain-containing protein [Streptomyces sp. AP-93]